MLTDTLIIRTRRYLADTGRGYSEPVKRVFQDIEITDALTIARERLLLNLRQRPPEAGILTICRSVAVVSGVEGAPVPADMLTLECGIRANVAGNDPLGYIPVRSVSLGEQLVGMDGIYADGALFHGTAFLALYYKKPSINLATPGLMLTDFPDAFYNTLATMAAASLVLKKPGKYSAAKSKALEQLTMRQIRSLK